MSVSRIVRRHLSCNIIEMAESGVINTVVVKNGVSYNVSIQRANGPLTNVPSAVKPVSVAKPVSAAEPVQPPPVSANVPIASKPFVAPIIAFTNHIQQNYNQSDMTKAAIDTEISELQVKEGRMNTLRDKDLQKKVELGRNTFAKYIKEIIANERGRIEKIGENAVRQQRLQKNTRQTLFKEKELAAKQEEYNAAFAAENAQQTRYIAANKKIGDSEKEYPIMFRDVEERVKEVLTLKEAKQREVEQLDNERKLLQVSNSNAPLSSANQQKIDEAERKYNASTTELEKLTKLQIQRSVIKDDFQSKFPTLKDYEDEQKRLANIEKDELNRLSDTAVQQSKEVIKTQQELRTIEAENKQEEDKAKNTSIISSIKEIVGKVIPLITTRLNAMNEIEKAVKAGLTDYLVNRTIDETQRDEIKSGESQQNSTGRFVSVLTKIRDNEDLPNSIIDRMVKAAEKVHYSTSPSLAPSTFNLEDTAAKANIKQEFYKMESPKWEKWGLSGGRRTLRRKNVRRKTRRITHSY